MDNKTIRHFGKNTLNEFVEEVKERIISKIEKIEKTIPTKVSQLENDTVFATEEYVNNNSGKVKTVNGNEPDENGNIEIAAGGGATAEQLAQINTNKENIDKLSEEIDALDGLIYGIYVGDTQPTNGVMYWLDTSEDSESEEPDTPVEPDVPEVTLSSISATYTGGEVAVGTALTDLTGITVKATYSDGSTANVTDYTLSGTIAEGENTITVSFEGKTTTFTVNGVAEVDSEELMCESNIVKEGHSINKNAQYTFYQLDAKEDGVNVYEIQVEKGVTYEASLTNENKYGVPYWSAKTLDKVEANNEFAISSNKLTDLETVGSRVTWTFDGNTVLDTSTATTRIKNDDGTYTRKITFTPAIDGYLYVDNLQTVNKYSIKKAVA